jgi:signal transduction histidine kinase
MADSESNRLLQALISLTSNVIKFTDTGFVHLQALSIPQRNDTDLYVKFSINDIGIGIFADK